MRIVRDDSDWPPPDRLCKICGVSMGDSIKHEKFHDILRGVKQDDDYIIEKTKPLEEEIEKLRRLLVSITVLHLPSGSNSQWCSCRAQEITIDDDGDPVISPARYPCATMRRILDAGYEVLELTKEN